MTRFRIPGVLSPQFFLARLSKTRTNKNSTKLYKCGKSAPISLARQAIECPDDGRRVKLEQKQWQRFWQMIWGWGKFLQKRFQEFWVTAEKSITKLDHPPYLPDLFPCDFWLLPELKIALKRRRFDGISDIQSHGVKELKTIPGMFWAIKASSNWVYWRTRGLLWRW